MSVAKKVVIIYHYPCPDGVFGALGAYLHFSVVNPAQSLRFCPLTVWSKPEEREALVSTISKDEDVFLIDFSGGIPFMTALCGAASSVTLLDHHADTAESLPTFLASSPPSNFHHTMDMARSGAQLSWDFFNLGEPTFAAFKGSEEGAKRMQSVFALIQDNDLFLHKLPGSKAFTAGFAELKLEYNPAKNPSIWSTLLALDAPTLIATGTALLEEQAAIRAKEREGAFAVAVPSPEGTPTLKCLALITQYPDLRSMAGNELAELSKSKGMAHASAICYTEAGAGEGVIKVSLRSVGDCDIMVVARHHGGGGHKVRVGVFVQWALVYCFTRIQSLYSLHTYHHPPAPFLKTECRELHCAVGCIQCLEAASIVLILLNSA